MCEESLQTDQGMVEVLRIYEDRKKVMLNTIDSARRSAQFLVTAASVILTIFTGLIGPSFSSISESCWKTVFTVLAILVLFVYIAICFLLIKPLQFFKWVPGVSEDRKNLLDYFYGQTEEEILNRRIAILIEEIKQNRPSVNKSAQKVDIAQILFAFSIVILLAMFFISRL